MQSLWANKDHKNMFLRSRDSRVSRGRGKNKDKRNRAKSIISKCDKNFYAYKIEIRLYAKLKGLKQHWAYHTYADRHGIDKNMYNWQKIVFDKLKELEHENNFTYEETKNVRS